MFVLSLFDPQEDEFPAMRPQIARLWGVDRTIPLLGNGRMLDWLLCNYKPVIAECRKKDNAVLRALLKLPGQFCKEGSALYKTLIDSGYSTLEIRYANSWMIWPCQNPVGLNPNGIPAEKAAAQFCIAALNQDEELPDEAFTHMERLYSMYRKFHIRYEGHEGICLSYVDGQYRECLLSSFDSNKKILLAKKNGKVIGRAVIRLTKGRDYLRDDVDAPTLEFADLTKPPEKRYEDERPADQLTLFLERPYFKNANYSETAVIKQMFISLVRKKAMQMLATPVLAICYEEQCAASDFVRMRYALYISKSKGGAQYLDSLDGQVKVSREGSFKAFPFLVLPSNEMAAIS